MPSQKNIDQLNVLKDKLAATKSVVLTDHSGLNVADQTQLRANVAQVGGEFTIAKNTLLKLALKNRLGNLPRDLEDVLQGPTSVLFSNQDAVAALKALDVFIREKELPQIKLGLLQDRILSPAEINQLALLPTKDQLIVMLISQLNAPRTGLVSVLSGNLRKLTQVIKAIKDSKESN